MHTFGASAPLKELQKKFGFEPDRVVAIAKELLRSIDLETSAENCEGHSAVPVA
jgi:transketolase